MEQILFIDDDLKYHRSLKRLFRREPWHLHFCESVDQAMDFLNTNKVDLIISDIVMPEKSGLHFLEKLKQDKITPTVPVIMMTGKLDEKLMLKSIDLGCTDFIYKPLRKAELKSRINNCIRLKKFNDESREQNKILKAEIERRKNFARLVRDVSAALIEKDLNELLQKCCQSTVDHLQAAFARIWVFDSHKQHLELLASAGMYTHLNGNHHFIPIGHFKIGLIAKNKRPHLTNSVIGDPQVSDQVWAKKEKMVSFAGYPLLIKDRLIGVLGMFSKEKLHETVIEAISSIADGIALGIDRKKVDEKVHFYSSYDPLTQLPNRRLFNVFLGKMVSHANRYQKRFALILIDIDNFSKINESIGYNAGDQCLKILAKRLQDTLRNSDFLARFSDKSPPVARMDGDEFAVLLPDIVDLNQMNSVLNRITNELSQNLLLHDREVTFSVSMGISLYPDDADSIADLIKNSLTALYHAKRRGKNNFSFYSGSMNEKSLEMLDLETDLRRAIKNKEFSLYYQPKVSVPTQKVVGAEALIRWKNQKGDLISPAQFIPLAEATGLIIPIGDWVAETAYLQNVAWQTEGLKKVPIAINVSGQQFGQENFSAKLLNYAKKKKFMPEYIELEITETTIMMNPDNAIRELEKLKEYGFGISLDDFGTGYSSLSYLQKLPIDKLKIDMSFIKNVLSNPNDAAMVKAIISMAHNLGLKVIAEGVEDFNQLEFLANLNCDVIQGNLFSPPVPSFEFSAFIDRSFIFPPLHKNTAL